MTSNQKGCLLLRVLDAQNHRPWHRLGFGDLRGQKLLKWFPHFITCHKFFKGWIPFMPLLFFLAASCYKSEEDTLLQFSSGLPDF
jgi:hypothetical protein